MGGVVQVQRPVVLLHVDGADEITKLCQLCLGALGLQQALLLPEDAWVGGDFGGGGCCVMLLLI